MTSAYSCLFSSRFRRCPKARVDGGEYRRPPGKKKTPRAAGYLSLACVWRSVFVLIRSMRGSRRGSPHSRSTLYWNPPACLLPSRRRRRLSCLLYKQHACQSARDGRRFEHVVSATWFKCDASARCEKFFAPVAASWWAPRGGGGDGADSKVSRSSTRSRPGGPGSGSQRTAQIIECKVESSNFRGVNELDTVARSGARDVSVVVARRGRLARGGPGAGCRSRYGHATSAGARARCAVLDPRLLGGGHERRLSPRPVQSRGRVSDASLRAEHFARASASASSIRRANRYAAALRRIAAAKDGPLSDEDQRIKDMWGSEGTPSRLSEGDGGHPLPARAGGSVPGGGSSVRGAWETHIAETLANLGLPPELAVLPHVESSFNPAAFSKVGAAGLWQFMRSTGRRYMRIDSAVDDRLDPFRSTEAAAQLLAYNYRISWAPGRSPLPPITMVPRASGTPRRPSARRTSSRSSAITTGARSGLRPAISMSPSWRRSKSTGNPEKYFSGIEKQSEAKFQEVIVPGYVSIISLERALKIDGNRLRSLNPALLRAVWDGQRHVPKAYHLRLPMDGDKWTSDMLAARLNPSEMYAGQAATPALSASRKATHLVSVADDYGISAESLARLNRMRTSGKLRVGRVINLPEQPAVPIVAAITPAPTPAAAGPRHDRKDRGSARSHAECSACHARAYRRRPPAATEEAGIYIVKRGESLAGYRLESWIDRRSAFAAQRYPQPRLHLRRATACDQAGRCALGAAAGCLGRDSRQRTPGSTGHRCRICHVGHPYRVKWYVAGGRGSSALGRRRRRE